MRIAASMYGISRKLTTKPAVSLAMIGVLPSDLANPRSSWVVSSLVAMVRTILTSDETVETLKEFARTLGKTPIVAKDRAGFIVNFLLIPYMLAAIRMHEQGAATMEDIDTGMKLGCGYPMGPFELLDYVGLDTTLWAAEAIYAEFSDEAYNPPTMLRRMVQAGRYGKKNGKGFWNLGITSEAGTP